MGLLGYNTNDFRSFCLIVNILIIKTIIYEINILIYRINKIHSPILHLAISTKKKKTRMKNMKSFFDAQYHSDARHSMSI